VKRFALLFAAALLAPTLAQGATLTVSAVNPFGAPLSGTGLMLAIDTQDAVNVFLGVEDLTLTGTIGQKTATNATLLGFLSDAPNVQTATEVSLANAFEAAINWTRDDSYWLAGGAAPNDWTPFATGIEGGGVADGFMTMTATAGALPSLFAGGVKDIAYIVIDAPVTLTGVIVRGEGQAGRFEMNHYITPDGNVIGIPEPSSLALLAIAAICMAPWIGWRRR
jgi:PEP-CTERM motif